MAIEEDSTAPIELEDEVDGEEVGTRNYRFCKIGASVPLRSPTESPLYEFDSLPFQPLAVSERLHLFFVAHPQGFYVARTKDVMASAEEIKAKKTGSTVQELSLVDVPIQNVSILALSNDDSLLAATVATHVHFFAVSALLHKEQKPSYSTSLDDSSCIKDMIWARKMVKEYVLLSANGKLYHGSGQGPLRHVMDDVDSVDWSTKEDFVAVARKNALSILSAGFKEKISLKLSFRSLTDDSEVNQALKVESIRWFRPDCIAVGCFQLDDSGGKENYVVQVITSRGRSITDLDASSKPIVLSFNNVFLDFCADVLPPTYGRHLFLSYLDLHGLAFLANKLLSRHVGLLRWSLDNEKNEAAMVEILDDAWYLYIDSQENGEENVILGLSVDKVSQNENVKLTLGDEETEVTPCCVIFCVTIDGKVSIFHFASAVGASVPSVTPAPEERDVNQVSTKHEVLPISLEGSEESREKSLLRSESCELEKSGIERMAATENRLTAGPIISRVEQQVPTESIQHKNLVSLQVPIRDELRKPLSTMTNEDRSAVKHSISGATSSAIFSAGKVTSDISSLPSGKLPLSGYSLEPSSKASSTSLHIPWSLTMSKGRVDAVQPKDLNNKAKPALTAPGDQHLLQTRSVSETRLVESSTSRKSFKSEMNKELDAASSLTMPLSRQITTKQFGNVEEMTKKLDALLEDIVGKGGFKDESITSLETCFLELEEATCSLSERCRTWKGIMDDQLKEVQLLLDKTVQVVVRKVYMEGIFKQASDSRYWEFWNCQRLSSELELKQRRISDSNQELTNQLIDLENHFNSLEFHKFGENGEIQKNQTVLECRQGLSRNSQSFQSLHSTMNAQLAAAEQLSRCLSEQMAALRIESSGKHEAKKKIFESIGLPYIGEGHGYPNENTSLVTPLNSEKLTSYTVAVKEQSRQNQVSFSKSYEPETARRRRDSLDQSWTSFEPPKTTVKRMLLKDNYKNRSAVRPSVNIDRQHSTPWLQKISEVPLQEPRSASTVSFNHFGSKGTTKTTRKQSTESPLISFNEKNGSSAGSEYKSVQQTDKISAPISSMLKWSPELLLKGPTDSPDTLSHLGIESAKSAREQTSTQVVAQTAAFESNITNASRDFFSSGVSLSDKGKFTRSLEKPTQLHDGTAASSPSQTSFSGFLLSSSTSASLSSPVLKPTSTSFTNSSPLGSGAKQDAVHPPTSVPSALNSSSSLSLSTPLSNLSEIPASSTITKSQSPTALLRPPTIMHDCGTDSISQRLTSVANMPSTTENHVEAVSSTSQSGLAVSSFDVSLGHSVFAKSSMDSKSRSDFGGSEKSVAISTTVKSEQPQTAEALSTVALLSDNMVGSMKNVISDVSHEEEMEEEAPETDQTTEFALNNLGGFGIGSSPNSTVSKPNPFGVSNFSKENVSATPQFTLPAPTGELFRPASFNFQSSQPAAPSQPTAVGAFSGGFSTGYPSQVPAASGFGQPAHIGPGQQAMGSVLGTFGQSRQFGTGLTGNAAPTSGFGGGFMGNSASAFGGGFASASTGGGFSSLAAGGGGFAAAATAGGGFAAAASAGGGFTSSVAPVAIGSGGGFGAFSSQQGSGGFSAFGGSSGTGRPPSELFTQMRK